MTRKTPLRSKTPLKRSRGLRNASPKRQREYKEYAKVKKAYLALHPICERCKKAKSQDIHHKAGRNGRYLCEYSLFAALCRTCHDEVHANGKEARKQGWIIDTIHRRQDG
jgi:4-alpha-glucanotransferase